MIMIASEVKLRSVECIYNWVNAELNSITDCVERLCSPCIEDVTVFFGADNVLSVAGSIADKRYYIGLREFMSIAERNDGMSGDMLISNASFVKNA